MKRDETEYETFNKRARLPAPSAFPSQILSYKYILSLPLTAEWPPQVLNQILHVSQSAGVRWRCGMDSLKGRAFAETRLVWASVRGGPPPQPSQRSDRIQQFIPRICPFGGLKAMKTGAQ